MFSRRHPFLFFILVFSAIAAVALVGMGILVQVAATGGACGFWDDSGGQQVGLVEITGVITDAQTAMDHLKRFREDDAIRAIVVRIDSPGGAVGPSQEIFREIRKTLEIKPVVASLGTVAASGGYYAAAATSGIMANPGTLTGSIGVIMGFTNFQDLLGKIGLTSVVVKSGQYKDMGSPTREMTSGERRIFQEFVDQINDQFVAAVSEGRKMGSEQVSVLADGRIFSGQQARELGLVDRLGNFEDAVQWAAELAGVEGPVGSVIYFV